MSDEVLDTDFLPLDMITTAESCMHEIAKCDDLRLALNNHQFTLVKLYAKLTNKKVVLVRQHFVDTVIDDFCVVDKSTKKEDANLIESMHYEIVDFGDGQIVESKEM
jgi:hypothetical protein